MVNVVGPALRTVILLAAVVTPTSVDAKVMLVGETMIPVPLNGTLCGLPVALSAIARLAVRAPVA